MIVNRAGDWGGPAGSAGARDATSVAQLYAVPVEVLTIGSAVAALVMILLAKRAVQVGLDNRWLDRRPRPPSALVGTAADRGLRLAARDADLSGSNARRDVIPAYLALAGVLARAQSPRERLALAAALVITLIPSTLQVAFRPATESWDEVAAYLHRNCPARRPGVGLSERQRTSAARSRSKRRAAGHSRRLSGDRDQGPDPRGFTCGRLLDLLRRRKRRPRSGASRTFQRSGWSLARARFRSAQ